MVDLSQIVEVGLFIVGLEGVVWMNVALLAWFATLVCRVSLQVLHMARFIVLGVGVCVASPVFAQQDNFPQQDRGGDNPVYTVSNFEVWAEAKDAVLAKRAAHDDGKVVAFSQLLKRLTPYSSYKYHPTLTSQQVTQLIAALSVKDERNSSTEYLANMDFKFSVKGVKKLLKEHRLPYWDRQAEPVLLVPVVDQTLLTPPEGTQKSLLSQEDWVTAWKTLDLAHGLVPLVLKERLSVVDDAVLAALIRDETRARAGLLEAYKARGVVVALISATPAKNKLRLTLVGRDGVGDMFYKRDHIITKGDVVQAADLAAEVAQGMFDSRLKLTNMNSVAVAARPVEVLPWQTDLSAAAPVTGWQSEVDGERVMMHVQFRGFRHWQSIRQRLMAVQGLDGLNIEKLSARGADISCQFPGGADALKAALQARGMVMQQNPDGWILFDG